jgi:ubiquinone/menaquinone biosynthesis C-methylase UbiE
MPERGPADWQLPPGVDRPLWDYIHDEGVAAGYDAALADSSLFQVDQEFVARHCPAGGHLLDLGCGTGRLLIDFAARGCRVVGVDLSAPMLRVAQARATATGVAVDLVQANLVELSCLAPESFDCAACLFSTLGMIRGADARHRVLEHAWRVLRPGGHLLLHVHNRWFNVFNPAGRRWLVRDWFSSTPGDRRMPAHQGIANLTLHLFTRREAVHLLQSAHFQILEVRPVSLRTDGRLRWPAWFGWLRAYGYLIAAKKPGGCPTPPTG